MEAKHGGASMLAFHLGPSSDWTRRCEAASGFLVHVVLVRVLCGHGYLCSVMCGGSILRRTACDSGVDRSLEDAASGHGFAVVPYTRCDGTAMTHYNNMLNCDVALQGCVPTPVCRCPTSVQATTKTIPQTHERLPKAMRATTGTTPGHGSWAYLARRIH